MARKKIIELVQEVDSPKALIINGGETSSFLEKTLKDRGCEVEKIETYSPTSGKPASPAGRFDYIFHFDNQNIADEVYEKNLNRSGKFILIQTEDEKIPQKTFSHPRFKILKIGDPSFWSKPELADKILSTLFSGVSPVIVDLRRSPKVTVKKEKEPPVVKKATVPQVESVKPILQEEISVPVVPPILEKSHRFNFKKITLICLLIIFLTLLTFGGVCYYYALKLQKNLTSLSFHLKSSNLVAAASDLKETKEEIKTVKGIYDFSTNIFFPLKNISYVQDVGTLLETGEVIVDSGSDFTSYAISVLPPKGGFAQVGDNLSLQNLKELEKKIANFAATLIEADGKLDKVNLVYFPKDQVKATLSPIISKLSAVYEILPVAQQIFFLPEPKVYLVLFQNNMELRPTGGFIGSYALLTLANGKVLDFKIEDVYTADGQLKGHVDPPLPIRKYLSQPNFFLRDSNFDPDFAASAVQASFFLQKELGKDVDGVIGVNLTLAQKLLQVVGAIRLSDFNNEEITADNFFYKVHYLSQSNFFPGSTQKKDVLTGLSNTILTKLTTDNQINYLELLQVLKQALEEKNILLYLDNPDLQKIVEEHSWAGRMGKVTCTQRKAAGDEQIDTNFDTCFADYLSIIEANLGVNKANYFISKSEVIEKKISSDGQISSTVTISYENQNNTLVNPSQTYTNYLRIFVPLGSKLVSASLNNTSLIAADIDTSSYADDKTVFGFLVKIAPDNKGVVKITYLLPRPLTDKMTSYQLFYQKQGGDKNSPLVFSLIYPAQFRLKPVNFTSSSSSDNEIFYTTDTSVDRVFALNKN